MLSLKNALNAGQQLRNTHNGEQLILDARWTVPYSQFDGTLAHVDATGQSLRNMAFTGFYATFEGVFAYANEHAFADTWQVVDG
jgi:hypothetical protein